MKKFVGIILIVITFCCVSLGIFSKNIVSAFATDETKEYDKLTLTELDERTHRTTLDTTAQITQDIARDVEDVLTESEARSVYLETDDTTDGVTSVESM